MTPPTLVLVHGAWHGPWCWDALAAALPDVPIVRVDLPSVGQDPADLGDLDADAAAVRDAVSAVGGPVIVCAHSYGGVPATQALADRDDVLSIVYLCAFLLDVGESLAGALGGGPVPDWWDLHAEEGYLDVLRPKDIFYADVEDATADAAVARLAHQGLAALGGQLTKAAWRTVPSTYVVCEQDQAIPVPAQEAMSRHATTVLRLGSSHSPFLSHTAEVAEILRTELDAARRPVGTTV